MGQSVLPFLLERYRIAVDFSAGLISMDLATVRKHICLSCFVDVRGNPPPTFLLALSVLCSPGKDWDETAASPILVMYCLCGEGGLQGALKTPLCLCLCLINKLKKVIAEGGTEKEGLLHCKALTHVIRDTASCTAEVLQRLRTFGHEFLGNKALSVNSDSVFPQLQVMQLFPNEDAVTEAAVM